MENLVASTAAACRITILATVCLGATGMKFHRARRCHRRVLCAGSTRRGYLSGKRPPKAYYWSPGLVCSWLFPIQRLNTQKTHPRPRTTSPLREQRLNMIAEASYRTCAVEGFVISLVFQSSRNPTQNPFAQLQSDSCMPNRCYRWMARQLRVCVPAATRRMR